MNLWYNRKGEVISAAEADAELRKDRHVAETTLPSGIYISTVFLGLDHGMGMEGPPILFETMVFSEKTDKGLGRSLDMSRYQTEEEAKVGHRKMVNEWIGKPIPPEETLE